MCQNCNTIKSLFHGKGTESTPAAIANVTAALATAPRTEDEEKKREKRREKHRKRRARKAAKRKENENKDEEEEEEVMKDAMEEIKEKEVFDWTTEAENAAHGLHGDFPNDTEMRDS